MPPEKFETLKAGGVNNPENPYQDPHTGEVITKKEKEEEKRRKEDNPHWFREQK